jgi:hypothetical protein
LNINLFNFLIKSETNYSLVISDVNEARWVEAEAEVKAEAMRPRGRGFGVEAEVEAAL